MLGTFSDQSYQILQDVMNHILGVEIGSLPAVRNSLIESLTEKFFIKLSHEKLEKINLFS